MKKKIDEESQATELQAFFNIINSFFGSGVLGLPYAFKNAGILAGIITLLAIACAANYCMKILVECANTLKEKLGYLPTYGELGQNAFGPKGY